MQVSTVRIVKISTVGDKKNVLAGVESVTLETKFSEGSKIFPKLPVAYTSFFLLSCNMRTNAEIAPNTSTTAVSDARAMEEYGSIRLLSNTV